MFGLLFLFSCFDTMLRIMVWYHVKNDTLNHVKMRNVSGIERLRNGGIKNSGGI